MTTTTDRAPTIPKAEDIARLTDRERDDLERAVRELGRARTRGAKETAQAKINKIAAKVRQRVIVSERSAGIAETLALAEARGEEVNRMPKHGAAEIETHDGLRRMHKLGHLTDEQLRTGLHYRAGHEARGADLKASQIGDSGGAGHDNDAFVRRALDRAKLAEFVGKTDRAVALGCISNPAALQVLRHVAGQGGNVTDFGKGRALERNRAALVTALDIARGIEREMARKEQG